MTIRVNGLAPEYVVQERMSYLGHHHADNYPQNLFRTIQAECSKSKEICVLDVGTGASTVLSTAPKASEVRWLGQGRQLVWLEEGENGNTKVVVSSTSSPAETYTAGTIPGPVSNLKLYYIKPGTVAIAVSGQANPDGGLYNPRDAPQMNSTARLYDSLFVRHWDAFITKQRNSIFTGLLQSSLANLVDKQKRYQLVGFTNALKGTGLECPIPPFGGTDHFDIGPRGLVIVAKDPHLDPATHTKCNTYFIPKEDFTEMSAIEPQMIESMEYNGAATSPVFSSDGNSIAFLKMKEDGYESDKNVVMVVPNIGDSNQAMKGVDILSTCGETVWDHSPGTLLWSHDGSILYMTAEDQGSGCLFALSLHGETNKIPEKLTHTGYISDVSHASKTSNLLFLSGTSLIDNSTYSIIDPKSAHAPTIVSSATEHGSSIGVSSKQVRSLWWKGDKDHPVHAWMVVPSFFRSDHKYPLAYLIHGGPQGAWNDQWSTRWNPAVFAEQGYVVICPNPTGSTGYGQAFTDAIKSNWGGSPYIDLEKGFEYISTELPFVDTERTVALGASYGGYMMNWIQGHDLGRKFKALVCHDGVFSMTGLLASEEQYFPLHDVGGTLWEQQELYEKWDPSRFTKNWQTPMLVIHNDLDYRLTIAEGLSAFNVLQMKGVESRFLSFPDENHWVLNPENSLVWHLVVLNWINRFVGLPKVFDHNGGDGDDYLRQGKP